MALTLFNTLTRRKDPFVSIKPGKVGMYCCGPTVYGFAHIGNLRTYIFEDILRRVLEYNDYEVKHVMNVTDVGHLTDDADDGEDKMEKGARRDGKTVWEVAEFYTQAFLADTASLNILAPDVICKATEHVPDMIAMIKQLEKNGYTYAEGGNVYYDVSKFTYYADLGRLKFEDMRATDRVSEDTGKKNPQDFALWFTQSKFKNHAMQWDSPWGRGYPGWHIECSAMSTKYLGPQFDIHCGGIDHVCVHHTNEIAQTEGAYQVHPAVNYWIHGEFLVINEGRMGKSEGNFITLSTLKEKGYNPLAYRYMCLTVSYGQKLNFSYDALDNAANAFEALKKRVQNLWAEMPDGEKDLPDIEHSASDAVLAFLQQFLAAINEDLNMPKAVAVLHDVLKSDLTAAEKLALIENFDSIFALNLTEFVPASSVDVSSIQVLLDQRAEARAKKDWALSDKLRTEILSRGYILKDTPEGQVVEKA